MKRTFLILTLLSLYSTTELFAQREDKRERRAREAKEATQVVSTAIESNWFEFTATDLISAPHLSYGNIRLKGSYGVSVTPDNIKCRLPIYGSNAVYSKPTIESDLEFYLYKGEFEIVKKSVKSGWIVTIKIPKRQDVNSYTITMNISPTGVASQLSISSGFEGAAIFRGNITYDNPINIEL